MKYFFRFVILLTFVLPQVFLLGQQKKYLNFDENWQLSNSQYTQYYQCETYVLENGALDGPFTCYKIYSDTLVKKYHFKDNILDGNVYEYFDNGALKLEAEYRKGQAINSWKEWNEEGELVVDKTFDEEGYLTGDTNKKKLSEYEKMYFGTKPFEEPIYTSECILKGTEYLKYECSQDALNRFYNVPPLPPSYFNDVKFSGKEFQVKLRYLLSEKGKVDSVYILETSGDAFLDDLAETHVLNMMPFEAAKEYENPIKYWMEAILYFRF